ncbi:MAG: hypothetical protein M3336_06285, partial [Chloroflexota bacterium]|nr:hypothetical protein [Chloroflexota bacterium]
MADRLLVVASSLDLTAPYSSTPAWWQLLKALAERGVDVVVTPYHGPAIASPWWTPASNPCQREGDIVRLLKRLAPSAAARATVGGGPLTRRLVERITRPRWQRHLARLLTRYADRQAVLFLTVPPNHFDGIPAFIARRFGIPTYFYDADVPASLPSFGGFRSGF